MPHDIAVALAEQRIALAKMRYALHVRRGQRWAVPHARRPGAHPE